MHRTIWTWPLSIFVIVVTLCVLGLYGNSFAQTANPPIQPFANAVEQRLEMVEQLREMNRLLREQNELLSSGKLRIIAVSEKP